MGGGMPLEIDDSFFREVDYGPDENKTDDEVMLRLGQVYAVKEGKNPAEMSEDALTDVGRHVIDLWNEKGDSARRLESFAGRLYSCLDEVWRKGFQKIFTARTLWWFPATALSVLRRI